MEVEVREFEDCYRNLWQEYITNHPSSKHFHRIEWFDVIQLAFKHQPHYLLAFCGEKLVGVMPIFEVKHFLFGHFLSSMPFAAEAGPLSDCDQVTEALLTHAKAKTQKSKAKYLELRSNTELPGLQEKDLYSKFLMPISTDEAENMKRIKQKQRTVIRKGMKFEQTCEVEENIDNFYHIYSVSVRNLGTPVFSKRFFELVFKIFGNSAEVFTVFHNGKAVASVFNLYWKGTVFPYWGGGLEVARGLKSFDVMYYKLMSHAAKNHSCNMFDFGRSKKGTGAYTYKKHWNMEIVDIRYRYHLEALKELPNLSPTNSKYSIAIEAWKKLPLPITQFIGPYVSKYLG